MAVGLGARGDANAPEVPALERVCSGAGRPPVGEGDIPAIDGRVGIGEVLSAEDLGAFRAPGYNLQNDEGNSGLSVGRGLCRLRALGRQPRFKAGADVQMYVGAAHLPARSTCHVHL